jgi:hypothetical protein
MLIRTTLATLALTSVMMIQPHAANAAPYWPWCSQTYSRTTTEACAFASWEQCMETVRGGAGGHCYVNPTPPPAPVVRSARPSRHAARG